MNYLWESNKRDYEILRESITNGEAQSLLTNATMSLVFDDFVGNIEEDDFAGFLLTDNVQVSDKIKSPFQAGFFFHVTSIDEINRRVFVELRRTTSAHTQTVVERMDVNTAAYCKKKQDRLDNEI